MKLFGHEFGGHKASDAQADTQKPSGEMGNNPAAMDELAQARATREAEMQARQAGRVGALNEISGENPVFTGSQSELEAKAVEHTPPLGTDIVSSASPTPPEATTTVAPASSPENEVSASTEVAAETSTQTIPSDQTPPPQGPESPPAA